MSHWMHDQDDPLVRLEAEFARDHRRRARRRGVIGLGIAGAVAAGALLGAPHLPAVTQAASDQFVIWSQPTPSDLATYADATGMSDEGRRIYLASTPRFDSPEDLAEDCLVDESIVLGCYTGTRIYLFDVADERLAGTNEVTAAHEMLHAAYDRLPAADREEFDRLAAELLAALPQEHPLRAALAGYPASQHADELHSRLGTEVTALPAVLERHYDRFFDDRSKVLALHASSNAALDEVTRRIAELGAQVDALSASLAAREAAWEADTDALDADIAAFNDRASTPGGFPTQSGFDAARRDLEARVAANEAERTALNAEVDRYNALVGELNGLGETSRDLYASLDSRVDTGLDG